MNRNRLKKVLCLVLVIAALFSLPVTAYASDGKTAETGCILSRIKQGIISSVLSCENVISKSVLRAVPDGRRGGRGRRLHDGGDLAESFSPE